MPTTALTISSLKNSLRIRVFDSDGVLNSEVKESKNEPIHSPLHELRVLLASNWNLASLKPIEKNEIFRIATLAVRRLKIEEIIEAKQGLWRDDRIRDWLLGQFNNKCWYSEAQESVSSIHVDHYRPKGRLKQELGTDTEDGYWWLAFDWRNYRICGQLLNVKKGDLFPISEGVRCDAENPSSLKLEAPVLIDPLSEQTRLISYEKDEDGCIAVIAAGLDSHDENRAVKTIEIFGLNLRPRLNEKRNDFWDKCMLKISDYKNATGPQALKLVFQSSAKSTLKEMIAYDAEFSSVSEACIRKNAPEPLVSSIFEQSPTN